MKKKKKEQTLRETTITCKKEKELEPVNLKLKKTHGGLLPRVALKDRRAKKK